MARILLTDDNEPFRQLVAASLRKAGHIVTEASDGKEALEQFKVEPADLVITDIVMNNKDGIEAITGLRKACPGLPIIAMSGALKHSRVYLQVAKHLGANRVLEKPFKAAALLDLVEELLAPPKG